MAKKNRYRKPPTRKGSLGGGWTLALSTLMLMGLITALLAAGFSHGYHRLLQSRAFPLKKIEVEGLQRLHRETVLDALGIARGVNTLALRMKLLAERVERLDWVETAIVHLDFPATLVVEVKEHQPLAVVQETVAYLLDEKAILFARAESRDLQELPVVTGLPAENLDVGRRLPQETADSLRALFAALGIVPGHAGKSAVKRVRWDDKRGFTFQVNDHAPLVVLGVNDFTMKIDRLKKVTAVLARRYAAAEITEIDLDYGRRVYVRGRFGESVGI